MKNTKQLLIAAAVASMSLSAMADITISGEAKVNAKGGEYEIRTDLTITGKSGDTSVVAQLGLENSIWGGDVVEQLYMTSKVAGIDVKVGSWKSGKGELGQNWAGEPRISATTSFGGVKLTYQDRTGANGTSFTASGSIAGVDVSHKIKTSATPFMDFETKLSGSIGGIDAALHHQHNSTLWGMPEGDNTSVTLKTSIQGVDLTYVDTVSDSGAFADGLLWKAAVFYEARGGSVATKLLGNKIEYRDFILDGIDHKKLILTRKLASGATFEASYRDIDGGIYSDLDLELAVKF